MSDLFRRSPARYWTDFLLSAGTAWALTIYAFQRPPGSAAGIAALLIAGVLFFRAGTFMHEMVHMARGEMRWFKRVWNLLIGIPLLMPWVIYLNHVDHHDSRRFGTPEDGEYLPLASSPLRETFKYLLQAPLLPLMGILRFGIIGPLSHLRPAWREKVLTNYTAAVSNPYYRKRFPAQYERHLAIVEWLCFAWLAFLGFLLISGRATPGQAVMAYGLMAWGLTLNWVRNLAAHGYGNRGAEMSHRGQLEDSINITGQSWLTFWLFPVGLRYHALHHLLPSLPYHNLGEAHCRLSAQLPPDSPYRNVNYESFFVAVRQLWQGARAHSAKESAMTRWREAASKQPLAVD